MPIRKKSTALRYSRKRDDIRPYNTNVYRPGIFDVLATKCTKDLEEAKSRVSIRNGRYRYEPSEAYKRFISKHYKTNDLW